MDSRAAFALIQRQVCAAPIAMRAVHDNPEFSIRQGDLLMFHPRGNGFRFTGLIRGQDPETAERISRAYAGVMAALYQRPPEYGPGE